ncbi:MAG: hypothetical protein R3C19_25770 [Planctomycetaceae bacterium]
MNNNMPDGGAPDGERSGVLGPLVAGVSLAGTAAFWTLNHFSPALSWHVLYLLSEVVLISVVIWQACDPFADAAQWVGRTFGLPGSVRGATLDAIASSMPELFSGIFFVTVAVAAAGDSTAAILEAGAEGYGATIATCAGSAVYNMILIPAFCAIVISFYRTQRPTIDVEDEVLARDGLWFVVCQMVLILFLFQDKMQWWMAIAFIVIYGIYIVHLYRDTKVFQRSQQTGSDPPKVTDNDDDAPDSAGILFGYRDIPLNRVSAALIIVVSTCVAAAACYFLVEATREAAQSLGVPTFFVAVILAAAASSVPDTFMSIGSAMRGDDSGAVSNAFGSSIFDICICLSIPLLVNSYLTGWEPVSMLQDGKPIAGLVGLRILLVVLTVITLAIIWHRRQLTRNKAFVLCGLYLVFIGYAVFGSLGIGV